MEVRFGHRDLTYPSAQLAELRDANDLLGDRDALQRRLEADGYLLLRGLIDRPKVERARATILEYMAEREALTPGEPVLEGVMPEGGKSVPMLGRKAITHHEDVLAVLESPELFDFFSFLFDEPARTFDYKWLRAVGNEQYTSAHYDVVYMGRGSGRLHTAWVPFGDADPRQSTLAMCVGSHNQPSFQRLRETYGRSDVDRDHTAGWFTRDPMEIVEKFGGQWATTSYRMGDVILFGMFTMHASTTNLTDRYRLSCDIRFQPAADPVDERWVGENPIGHYAWAYSRGDKQKAISIEESRAAWGV